MNAKREFTPHQLSLIEQYRDCNADHDWYSYTYDYFIEQLGSLGLDLFKSNIQFSGFWSQGDGASFTFSSWSLTTVLEKCMARIEHHEALEHEHGAACMDNRIYKHCIDFAYEVRKQFAKFLLLGQVFGDEVMGSVCVNAYRTNSHYSHSKTVRAEWDWSEADRFHDCGGGEENLLVTTGLLGVLREFDIDEAVEEFANALYKELEAEYEYQTSDEQVWEAIKANGWDEDEEVEEDACEAA